MASAVADTSPSPTISPTDGNDDSLVMQTAPPVEPSESTLTDGPTASETADPDVPGAGCTPKPGFNCPNNGCDPGSWFKPKTLYGRYFKGVGYTQTDYNGTHYLEDMQFTSQTAGTVGVSYTGSLTTKVSAVVADASTTWGVSLSASLTVTVGNSVTVKNVAPGTEIHATYGVWRRKFTGTSYRQNYGCNLYTSNNTVYGPYHVGWYTWDS
ncbi:hypothetical protein [Streptomyces sp. NPDC001070]